MAPFLLGPQPIEFSFFRNFRIFRRFSFFSDFPRLLRFPFSVFGSSGPPDFCILRLSIFRKFRLWLFGASADDSPLNAAQA
jgi:hypothetical protein